MQKYRITWSYDVTREVYIDVADDVSLADMVDKSFSSDAFDKGEIVEHDNYNVESVELIKETFTDVTPAWREQHNVALGHD